MDLHRFTILDKHFKAHFFGAVTRIISRISAVLRRGARKVRLEFLSPSLL
jgi:hypothetical protein